MTGFEPQTFGIGSDRSTNWATTTAPTDVFTMEILVVVYLWKRGLGDSVPIQGLPIRFSNRFSVLKGKSLWGRYTVLT